MFPRSSQGSAKPSTTFRALINDSSYPVVGVTGATAQQAQIAAAAGFKFFTISGAHTSCTLLGLPDAGLITMTEIVENTRNVCGAVTIPVQVDCDTGFGNAINVGRTVESMIRAGAASIFLEDQVAPKRCGFSKGKELVSIEEAAGKLRAACAVRDSLDPDFVIFARTDARGAVGGGLDEVLRRTEAYLEAGVDALYLGALQSREEARTVRTKFPEAKLRATFTSAEPPITLEESRELGLCMTTIHVSVVAAMAVHDFLHRYLKEGDAYLQDFSRQMKTHPLGDLRVFDLAGFPEIYSMEEKFLPKETQARYEASSGDYDPRKDA